MDEEKTELIAQLVNLIKGNVDSINLFELIEELGFDVDDFDVTEDFIDHLIETAEEFDLDEMRDMIQKTLKHIDAQDDEETEDDDRFLDAKTDDEETEDDDRFLDAKTDDEETEDDDRFLDDGDTGVEISPIDEEAFLEGEEDDFDELDFLDLSTEELEKMLKKIKKKKEPEEEDSDEIDFDF